MISMEYYDRIEEYLLGRLKPNENLALENEIATNNEVRKLYELSKDLFVFIKENDLHDTLNEVERLRILRKAAKEKGEIFYEENENLARMLQTFNEIHEERMAKKENRKARPVFFYSKVKMSIIAALLVIAGLITFYLNTQNSSYISKKNNPNLFLSFTRSSSNNSPESAEAFAALAQRRYADASQNFTYLLKNDSFNFEWSYYQGIALLMQGQFANAEIKFQFIKTHTPNLFYDRAQAGLEVCKALRKKEQKK